MKYREISRKLKILGCHEIPRRGAGSHRVWHNPDTDRIAPIPDWRAKDLKMGTMRAIIRQLGLDWKTFLDA
jgi:predicted RNA binding protein YcfA (HicA-like mRNA interferase family)